MWNQSIGLHAVPDVAEAEIDGEDTMHGNTSSRFFLLLPVSFYLVRDLDLTSRFSSRF
jgi:hypothetical protein